MNDSKMLYFAEFIFADGDLERDFAELIFAYAKIDETKIGRKLTFRIPVYLRITLKEQLNISFAVEKWKNLRKTYLQM